MQSCRKGIRESRMLGAMRRRIWARITAQGKTIANLLSLAIAAAFLAGCATNHDIFTPASDNASRVTNLTVAIFWIAAFVFVAVEALLLYTIIRYRRRPGQGMPKQITGNVPLEVGWTAFPAIVLAVVFALTLRTLGAIVYDPPNQLQPANNDPAKAVHIRVIGHQWWWEYQYPDLKIITANEMHVPVGATVFLDVESSDVIHSFWIPTLGPKMDAIPGQVNKTWFSSTKAGKFFGQCSEYCGQQHAMMREVVIAEPLDQFNAWVKDQQQPIPANLTGAAQMGQTTFGDMPCGSCHAIAGTKWQGKVGPDLTHFASRSTFAGASFDNTKGNLTMWLLDPQAMKPGNHMPNLGTVPAAVSDLVAFLESLK